MPITHDSAAHKPKLLLLPTTNTRKSFHLAPNNTTTNNLLSVIKRIPTKRTTTTPTRPKPLKQTCPMKQIPTRPTPLIRDLEIASHNAIANGTFALTLHNALRIALERHQTI